MYKISDKEKLIDIDFLKSILHYDSETGIFTWLIKPRQAYHIGDIAGTKRPDGYYTIKINGKDYSAHRLAWLYMNGEWPNHEIDHIDLNKSNNCWNNLRAATDSQQGANRGIPSNNTSGIKGVRWRKDRNKWEAYIRVKQKLIYLGRFDTHQEAEKAYETAAILNFGSYFRIG